MAPSIPEDTYRGIAMPGAALSEMGGKEYVAINMKVTHGEMAGETVPWKGWLTEKAIARTLSSLRAMGWGGNIRDLSGLDNEVEIVVKHETYRDKTSAVAAFINSPKKELDAGKLSALEARIAALQEPADPFADPVE
jgi:hypothetical protein